MPGGRASAGPEPGSLPRYRKSRILAYGASRACRILRALSEVRAAIDWAELEAVAEVAILT